MQNESYKVIFTGEIIAGYNIDTVKNNLAKLFKVNTERIERLFTGQPTLIKDKLNQKRAAKYEETLRKAGAICRVECDQVVPPAVHVAEPAKPAQDNSDGRRGIMKLLAFGIIWFMILYVVSYVVVICILSAVITYRGVDPASVEAVGEAMGRALVQQYNDLFLVGALGLAIFGTVSGLLPGTKKKAA